MNHGRLDPTESVRTCETVRTKKTSAGINAVLTWGGLNRNYNVQLDVLAGRQTESDKLNS